MQDTLGRRHRPYRPWPAVNGPQAEAQGCEKPPLARERWPPQSALKFLPMSKLDNQHIRNFSIIAHIDHGKSTLADRLLERTGTVAQRELREQMLDDMELERAARHHHQGPGRGDALRYKGEVYELNLIDTPGHVDFQYEVSRSLACCEGPCCSSTPFRGSRPRRWRTFSGHGARSDDRAGAQQDRSQTCPARRSDRRDGIGLGDKSRRRNPLQRQDWSGDRGAAGGDRRAGSAATRRPPCAADKRWCSIRTTTSFVAPITYMR